MDNLGVQGAMQRGLMLADSGVGDPAVTAHSGR